MSISLSSILVTQGNLRRSHQIPQLVQAISIDNEIPPIRLIPSDNNTYIMHDGHHRLVAYFLAGRTHLEDYEVEFYYNEPKPIRNTSVEELASQVTKQINVL